LMKPNAAAAVSAVPEKSLESQPVTVYFLNRSTGVFAAPSLATCLMSLVLIY
jgi:hypothetical protein